MVHLVTTDEKLVRILQENKWVLDNFIHIHFKLRLNRHEILKWHVGS